MTQELGSQTEPRLTYREMRSKAMVLIDEEVKSRVLAGIEALNEQYGPNWVDHVDPRSLIMSSGTSCVLGQVYDGYTIGVEKLNGGEFSESWAIDHGFQRDVTGLPRIGYHELDEAWKVILS